MTSHTVYAGRHTESLVDKFLAALAAFFSRLDSKRPWVLSGRLQVGTESDCAAVPNRDGTERGGGLGDRSERVVGAPRRERIRPNSQRTGKSHCAKAFHRSLYL